VSVLVLFTLLLFILSSFIPPVSEGKPSSVVAVTGRHSTRTLNLPTLIQNISLSLGHLQRVSCQTHKVESKTRILQLQPKLVPSCRPKLLLNRAKQCDSFSQVIQCAKLWHSRVACVYVIFVYDVDADYLWKIRETHFLWLAVSLSCL